MKFNKKSTIISLVLASVLFTGVLTAAAFNGRDGGNFQDLAKRIAEKFNLNQSEVQVVMEQFQEEKQATRQKKQEDYRIEKLNQLVADGKISEDQKNALLAKWEEMKNNRPSKKSMKDLRDLSEEERTAALEEREAEIKKHQEEMEQWLRDQGIDPSILTSELRMGLGGPERDNNFMGNRKGMMGNQKNNN